MKHYNIEKIQFNNLLKTKQTKKNVILRKYNLKLCKSNMNSGNVLHNFEFFFCFYYIIFEFFLFKKDYV